MAQAPSSSTFLAEPPREDDEKFQIISRSKSIFHPSCVPAASPLPVQSMKRAWSLPSEMLKTFFASPSSHRLQTIIIHHFFPCFLSSYPQLNVYTHTHHREGFIFVFLWEIQLHFTGEKRIKMCALRGRNDDRGSLVEQHFIMEIFSLLLVVLVPNQKITQKVNSTSKVLLAHEHEADRGWRKLCCLLCVAMGSH